MSGIGRLARVRDVRFGSIVPVGRRDPFPSRVSGSPHMGTRQYARIVDGWVEEIGLDRAAYGTHSMRRTKPTLIYRRTKNLRAGQLLLGHSKLESSVRYLGSRSTTRWRWRSRPRFERQPAVARSMSHLARAQVRLPSGRRYRSEGSRSDCSHAIAHSGQEQTVENFPPSGPSGQQERNATFPTIILGLFSVSMIRTGSQSVE